MHNGESHLCIFTVITIAFSVGLSALFVSTDWAMRRPLERGTGNRTGSTFCVHKVANLKSNLAAFREPGRIK